MSDTIVQKNISALCGMDNWRAGMVLFRDNAVLDAKLEANAIEAKVIHDIAKVERIRFTHSETHVACKCSCSRSRGFCAHAAAVLLEVHQRYPNQVNFLYLDDHVPQAVSWSAIADMVVATKAKPKENKQNEEGANEVTTEDHSEQTPAHTETPNRRVASLKKLLEAQVKAKLMFLINLNELPNLESRWGQVPLSIQILFNDRSYSGTNLKRVIDGNASGNMTMEDFSVREQQVIHFLVFNTTEDKNGFSLGAYDFSDLLHLLAGYQNIQIGKKRFIVPQADRVSVVLQVIVKEQRNCVVTPMLKLRNGAVLSGENCSFIAGRGGYWLGQDENYWWLPGCFNLAWLRYFLSNMSYELTSSEFATLKNIVEEGSFPAQLIYEESETLNTEKEVKITPIVQLDWQNNEIIAKVQYQYDSVVVNHWAPRIITVPGVGFISRSEHREREFQDYLKEIGFSLADEVQTLKIAQPEKILQFLDEGLPNIEKKHWKVFFSRAFRRQVHNSGKVILETTPDAEGSDWFSLSYRLLINQRGSITWQQAVEAVEMNKLIFFNPEKQGGVVRIDRGLATIIRILHNRTKEVTNTTMRFGIYAAVPVFQVLGKRWREATTRWQRLATAVMNPNNLPPLTYRTTSFTPRPYQLDGVAWLNLLAECGFHGILADEMGLGKTLQTLMLLSMRRDRKDGCPSLIICPTSLMVNWQKEAARFFPEMRVLIITSSLKDALSMSVLDYDLVITSYNLLRLDSDAYSAIIWNYMVLDEAQNIKNHRTANAISCKIIMAKYRLILTGTPLENSLTDLWSLFDFLLPGFLGNSEGFKKMYLSSEKSEENVQQLINMIKPFVLRRRKVDVCRQLPPKIEKVVYCEFSKSQRDLYEKVRREALEKLAHIEKNHGQGNRLELLTLILRLRQICCDPRLLPSEILEKQTKIPESAKLIQAMEIIDDAIANGHRLLLFSQFTSMLGLLQERIKQKGWNFEYLDGGTRDRQHRVDHFNKDENIPLFLLSLKAGGTGLNLTGADTVIHFDQWWNPMVEEQATDRSHRIGQHKTVTAIKLVVRNTIEERILAMQESKRELFQQIFATGSITGGGDELSLADIAFMLEDQE